MSRASESYERLSTAMIDTKPECLGLDMFTADDLDDLDIAVCKMICDACPLFNPCAEYAGLARPKAGVWAGKRYRASRARDDQPPRQENH